MLKSSWKSLKAVRKAFCGETRIFYSFRPCCLLLRGVSRLKQADNVSNFCKVDSAGTWNIWTLHLWAPDRNTQGRQVIFVFLRVKSFLLQQSHSVNSHCNCTTHYKRRTLLLSKHYHPFRVLLKLATLKL